MAECVADPRGWVRLDRDRDRTSTARHTVPAYPFDLPDAPEFPGRLYPLEAKAAVAARCWTNATAAACDPAPDFLAAGLQGT